jgi:copper transport protein
MAALTSLITIMVAALARPTGPALAHAVLVRSVPEANASLTAAPAGIELFFSENVEAAFSEIAVLDSNGQRLDNADTRLDYTDPTRLIVTLKPLPDGIYTVSWKVLSAVDGHVTTGAFPFAVGDADAAALAAAAQASRQIKISVGEVIARWMLYLALAALTGGALFTLVVWPRAEDWSRLTTIVLIVALLGHVLALLTQAGQAAGADFAAPWSDATARVLFVTRFGALWLARFGLLVALSGLVLVAAPTPRRRWIALGLNALNLLTLSLASHAAAEPQPLWPVLGDTLHLLAASVWVGGLLYFVAGLWKTRAAPPEERTRLTSGALPRFSALALLSVGVVVATGLYMSLLRIGPLDNLLNTFYGRVLLAKVSIALIMVGMGAINLLFVTPRLKRAAQPATLVARFRYFVTSEWGLGLLLMLSIALLTSLPPAQLTATTPEIRATQPADDLQMELVITPGRVGVNTFTLHLTANGQPVDNATLVALRFTPLAGQLAQSALNLVAQGNGLYTAKGANLSLPDTWQVQAVTRRAGHFDAFANYNVTLSATGASNTFSSWNWVTGGLAMLTALALSASLWQWLPTMRRRVAFGVAPALALGLLGAWITYHNPYPDVNSLVNPIPPSADSVAKGQAIYEARCLPCHGPYGKGDGPVGITLSPRPADLSKHGVLGVHPDGRLYDWITNGFPGNPAMQAFKNELTDEQRWHLVNYIRKLGELYGQTPAP